MNGILDSDRSGTQRGKAKYDSNDENDCWNDSYSKDETKSSSIGRNRHFDDPKSDLYMGMLMVRVDDLVCHPYSRRGPFFQCLRVSRTDFKTLEKNLFTKRQITNGNQWKTSRLYQQTLVKKDRNIYKQPPS